MNDIREAVIALDGVWPKEINHISCPEEDLRVALCVSPYEESGFKYKECEFYVAGVGASSRYWEIICTREQFEADAELWRKENEVKYKFEPVIDLDISELLRQHLSGEEFYSQNGELKYTFNSMLLGTIARYLVEGKICHRIECHWTENLPKKCVVWRDDRNGFSCIRIDKFLHGAYFCNENPSIGFAHALPITGTETIAEIEAMIAEAGE